MVTEASVRTLSLKALIKMNSYDCMDRILCVVVMNLLCKYLCRNNISIGGFRGRKPSGFEQLFVLLDGAISHVTSTMVMSVALRRAR